MRDRETYVDSEEYDLFSPVPVKPWDDLQCLFAESLVSLDME